MCLQLRNKVNHRPMAGCTTVFLGHLTTQYIYILRLVCVNLHKLTFNWIDLETSGIIV